MTFQTFTGSQYLKIDIANNFGLDKELWDDRIKWFNENEHNLHNMVHQADEPALFFAGLLAWEKYKRQEPSGYMISLDATSSGLQILAALTGDRKAAELCNVVDVGKRQDAYTVVYNQMCEAIGEEGRIKRDDCKQAIMTALYGSTAIPKEVFGEGALLMTFERVMKENAPYAWELNEAWLSLWDAEALSHDWVMPDNYHVHIKVMNYTSEVVHFDNAPYDIGHQVNAPKEKGRSLSANSTHAIDGYIVKEVTRLAAFGGRQQEFLSMIENATGKEEHPMITALLSHWEKTGILSSRILEYITVDNIHNVPYELLKDVIALLPKKAFKVVSIHDCFRVLPNYGNDIRRLYNNQLAIIAKSNLLDNLILQITGRKVTTTKMDKDLWQDILESNYALS